MRLVSCAVIGFVQKSDVYLHVHGTAAGLLSKWLTSLALCSCVGVWQNDRVEIIANDQGNRTTPSYVGFTDTERLIGDAAKNQVAMNPRNTVFDAKRLIGRKFEDSAVQQDMKHWPFTVIKGPDSKPIIEGKRSTPKLFCKLAAFQCVYTLLSCSIYWLPAKMCVMCAFRGCDFSCKLHPFTRI